MADTAARVQVHTEAAVGWIVLDNPGRHNAMTLGMWQALPAAVAALQDDPAVRVLVVRGQGDEAFVAGADISEFDQNRDSVADNERYEAIGQQAMAALAACPKPTVGMLQGWCLGGGMALALNCDLRIADDSLRFGIPAARLGIGYRWTGIKRLVDTVGAPNARHIMLTGRRFRADDALRMGFVSRLVARGTLAGAVREECELLAANAPITMKSIKLAIDEIQREGPHVDLERMESSVRDAYASQDFVEGRRAFMEKRAPRFSGR